MNFIKLQVIKVCVKDANLNYLQFLYINFCAFVLISHSIYIYIYIKHNRKIENETKKETVTKYHSTLTFNHLSVVQTSENLKLEERNKIFNRHKQFRPINRADRSQRGGQKGKFRDFPIIVPFVPRISQRFPAPWPPPRFIVVAGPTFYVIPSFPVSVFSG